jgi:histidinol-phosphate aminotransferase|tara:strand:+ start:309 stop:1412 length:1104 start_codon:yes stop_codon:yes gene_type:complete
VSSPSPLPGLKNISPYVGGDSDISGFDRVIKLASNEGAFGPSQKTIKAINSAIKDSHRYPDGDSQELREAISQKYSLELERLVCGCGSDELINLLCRTYAAPGDEIVHTAHGFAMYPIYAKTVGAVPISAPENNITACVPNIVNAITERTKLVFIANPNNPTGTYLPASQLMSLHQQIPSNVLLIIDSAYAEYVQEKDYSPGFELAKQNNNVIMLRTFSKIYGMGGIRLGWGYFPKEVADILNRVRSPFNVSFVAQAAGLAAIQDDEFVKSSQNHNHKLLKWTQEKLRSLGLIVPDSFGNFVLVRFPNSKNEKDNDKSAEKADAHLKSCGIIVRRLAGYGLPDALRVTIGTEEEMKSVINSITEFLN